MKNFTSNKVHVGIDGVISIKGENKDHVPVFIRKLKPESNGDLSIAKVELLSEELSTPYEIIFVSCF